MNAPRSLRRLFENDDGPQPNSFKFPLKASGGAEGSGRSGSFGQSTSSFSFPQSYSSSNISVTTPTASSFGNMSTAKPVHSEFSTIRLPTLDDDSDEEDALPQLNGSGYGSFRPSQPADNTIAAVDSRSQYTSMGPVVPAQLANQRKSYNLAQIVIPGIEDTVKFGASGPSFEIDSGPLSSYETEPAYGNGFSTGSGSQYGEGSDSGYTSGFGFNSRWNANPSSSPTTIKFQPDRHTEPGMAPPDTGFAFSPVVSGSSRPGMRRAETENPGDMQRPHQFPSAAVPTTVSNAPDYAPNNTFAFPSRPSSPFTQTQDTPSRPRPYQRSHSSLDQSHEPNASIDMPVLPSAPVRIEPGSSRQLPSALPRIFPVTNMGKMSEPPIRAAPMVDPSSRPGMPRQASVAVMEGASHRTPYQGMIPGSSQSYMRGSISSSTTHHRHRSSKASLGSGDSGRSYSLANNPDHAYPMPQSGQSSNGSVSMSRDRSQSTSGMESDVSSIAGGYDSPILSPTLDLREALKVSHN